MFGQKGCKLSLLNYSGVTSALASANVLGNNRSIYFIKVDKAGKLLVSLASVQSQGIPGPEIRQLCICFMLQACVL